MFEICAHPYHSTSRSTSSMIILDSIIRYLALTFVDADDPHTTTFAPCTVPAVHSNTLGRHLHGRNLTLSHHSRPAPSSGHPDILANPLRGCACANSTLASSWSLEHTPLWAATPAWDSASSRGEIRKESCRRLCWTAMNLAAAHVAHSVVSKIGPLNLFVANPANVRFHFRPLKL